jgi:hypothetical protein
MPIKQSGVHQDSQGSWLTGLSYRGETVFYTSAPVVLEAALTGSGGSIANATVRFYIDGALEGTVPTSGTGVATLEVGIMPAGVYTVTAHAAGSLATEALVAVCDRTAGCVTGGGWIESRPGAFPIKPSFSGPAAFGFVSRYEKGADSPTGTAEFYFKAATLSFHSSHHEWLVVTGGDYARCRGRGTICDQQAPNGQNFQFMLWAGDGTGANGADTFRIKIWWQEGKSEHVIYDNGADQPIRSGNIVVQDVE